MNTLSTFVSKNQGIKYEPKGHKKGLIIFLVVIILLTTGIFTLIYFLKKQGEDEIQKTDELSQIVKDLITTEGVVETLSFDPTINPSFKKYLFLRKRHTGINDNIYYYYYSTGENDLLGTESFITEKDPDGVILMEKHTEIVGYYGEEKPENKAVKTAYILYYVKLPEKCIVLRDTIWGTNPPPIAYRHRTSGSGEYPRLLEVVDRVKKAINNN